MDVDAFLDEVRSSPEYAGQIAYVREIVARPAEYGETRQPLHPRVRRMLEQRGIERLYSHQAQAVDLVRAGGDVLVVTGTASGKTLCYVLPVLEMLLDTPDARALMVFPTKALCQDQFKGLSSSLEGAGASNVSAGVYDGDTPGALRRKLRDKASIILTNPEMLHAGLMAQHARWAEFLSRLRFLVLDELHVYSGIFGSNMSNVLRRFQRLCAHYGSAPQIVACSATIGNPKELAEALTGRAFDVVDADGSPRGKRTYVFWNPPRIRATDWRSRRSANVEAHEVMARLIEHGVPTITFSKAKMTAEMIHRYVSETLREEAPHLAGKVTAYRGGYLPEERREIERRLFDGELLGVSTTRALELGIDVGALEASIIVGYPGTLASFFQQAGRAGRRDADALVVLVGLDTTVNQYVMSHPDYLFGRLIEQAVIDPDNPYVVLNHLRCATHELPLLDERSDAFGPHAGTVLGILEGNGKVKRIGEAWYHAASETPQHEVSLRTYSDANVLIEDVDTGGVLGQVDKYDAPPILHPEAIYMHRGETYRVLELDLERNIARVKREEVDYYTQAIGGTDVHHVDHCLRSKPFGTGTASWGEVTAYFRSELYEKIHFYSLDAISQHGLSLPTFALDTMALWLVPPEPLMEQVRAAGLDVHSGLRGIGYATRMLLPLFMTCDTLDFSHSIGAVNAPWNAIFVYERTPLGLGFTEKAYDRLHSIMPAVLDTVVHCPCEDGCPCCVGKPLRQYTTWNVERGEASVPSKQSSLLILKGLLHDGSNLDRPDTCALTDSDAGERVKLEQALKRRLERMREPTVFHPIEPKVPTAFPKPEDETTLSQTDAARRAERRRSFAKELRKRTAKHIPTDKLSPHASAAPLPPRMRLRSAKPPSHFPGGPEVREEKAAADSTPAEPIKAGDAIAARARRLKRRKPEH
ncbi:MAG: DEAD/DEAH box helicase [Verrucomicrobia bacterium]|nr:DEAD/DEAH box helicase [Verrucomicrobiota bacterium]